MDKNNDCYFYFYSTCTKEKNCPFRHCDLALGSEVVCELWRVGRCKDRNCPFRHMEPNINRSTIPCWFETQPQGCRKPHCVFMHTKPRPTVYELQTNRSEWILPTGTNNPANKTNQTQPAAAIESKPVTQTSEIKSAEKISISLDKDEESDDQETSETNTNVNTETVKEPGIKTLEQIKMERILNSTNDIHDMDSTETASTNISINPNIGKVDLINIRDPKRAKRTVLMPAIKPENVSQANSKQPQEPEKKKPEPIIVVKTLEQIRKERGQQQPESESNSNSMKENKIPNLSQKRALDEDDDKDKQQQQQITKPIKIQRNRINLNIFQQNNNGNIENKTNQDDGNKSSNDGDQEHEKKLSTTENVTDLEFEQFLDDDVSLIQSSNTSNINNADLNLDDDELMREIDQVINS